MPNGLPGREIARRKRGRPPGPCKTKYRKTPPKVEGVRMMVRDSSVMPTEAERSRLQAFCDQCAPNGKRADYERIAKDLLLPVDLRIEALRALWGFRCRLPLVEAELHTLVGSAWASFAEGNLVGPLRGIGG